MEAHAALASLQSPIAIESFGIGAKVRLPGESASTPNVYEFETPYLTMIKDLETKNITKYESNGILPMLRRDALVKNCPHRWLLSGMPHFDLIISFEHRVFDSLVTVIENSPSPNHRPSHVINFHTPDNAKDAATTATAVVELISRLADRGSDWPQFIQDDVQQFPNSAKREIIHRVCYY